MTDQKKLKFYFDYISPYSFLAWRKITDLCQKYDLQLEPEPILLGAILTHWETRGPAEIGPKREYTYKDVVRSAARDKVNLQFPPTHPFNPLPALRATCIMAGKPEYNSFITSLFEACWIEGRDISNETLILDKLKLYGIENGSELLKADSIKKILRDKTDQAAAIGVFGVPTMITGEELFWGNDRLEFLENYLKGEDPVDPVQLEKLVNLPRGIERKQK